VLRDGENRCLVLRRSASNRSNVGRWELPGGKMNPGETLGEALQREVREETGLEVELDRAVGSSTSHRGSELVVYLILEVHVRDAAASDVLRLSDEHDAHLWVDPDELSSLDLAPSIRGFALDAPRILARAAPRGIGVHLTPPPTTVERVVAHLDLHGSRVDAVRPSERQDEALDAPDPPLRGRKARSTPSTNSGG
jgi:8-oxo-dGTP diphosphatase